MAQPNAVEAGLLPIWRETIACGQALPSEDVLAELLGASRPAIREALIRMEANGLVRRLHGAGTFANPAALRMQLRLDSDTDSSARLAAAGFDVAVELLESTIVRVSESDVERMEFQPGTRALRTVKRWRANGLTVAAAVDHLPLARRVTDEQALEFASRPVRELAGILGLGKADWSCTWPSAVELAADVAERLEYDVGRAALCIEQVGVDRRNTRVFHALEHHRPGVVEYGPIRTTSS